MPIVASDIKYRLSAPGATAGGAVAAGPAGQSLGSYVSSTLLIDNTLDNLFPDITGDENAAMNVDYQCLFIHNSHPTLTLIGPKVWLPSVISGGATADIAVDNLSASPYADTSPQAAVITTKDSAPMGVSSFSNPGTKAAGLALGDLPPGYVKAIWVRRTATNSAALNLDGPTLSVEGDTRA